MTVMMLTAFVFLPKTEKYALPPKEIVGVIASKADLGVSLDDAQLNWLTLFAHFGFGGAAGGLFGVAARFLWQPLWSAGILFCLLVWLVSYMIGLPTLGILKPATKHPLRRNLLMVGAHIVWGFSLGLVFEWLAVTFRFA